LHDGKGKNEQDETSEIAEEKCHTLYILDGTARKDKE
jgi:hypothetical protein